MPQPGQDRRREQRRGQPRGVAVVRAAAITCRSAESRLIEAIRQARADGCTWDMIGRAAGTGVAQRGKSYVAGLIGEQLIRLGYSAVIFDPEGDNAGLGQLRGVLVTGTGGNLPSVPLHDPRWLHDLATAFPLAPIATTMEAAFPPCHPVSPMTIAAARLQARTETDSRGR